MTQFYNDARDWLHGRFGSHNERGIWERIVPDDITSLDAILTAAYRKGLEDAAKVAHEHMHTDDGDQYRIAKMIVEAIRTLAEKETP